MIVSPINSYGLRESETNYIINDTRKPSLPPYILN